MSAAIKKDLDRKGRHLLVSSARLALPDVGDRCESCHRDPHGGQFDPKNPRAFLRIERQTIWGFPEVDASLFTIRTYFEDIAKLPADKRAKVATAIESMTPGSLAYKGLAESRGDLLAWLRSL